MEINQNFNTHMRLGPCVIDAITIPLYVSCVASDICGHDSFELHRTKVLLYAFLYAGRYCKLTIYWATLVAAKRFSSNQ